MTWHLATQRKSFMVSAALTLLLVIVQLALNPLAAQTRLLNSGKLGPRLDRKALLLQASFQYGPTSPAPGQPVQFTDMSTGTPISWQWDFGDGASSADRNPSHTYAESGSYRVTLTVGISSICKSKSRTITVSAARTTIQASFTYSPSSPTVGQTVRFEGISSGNPTSLLWEFGDGGTSTSQNPSHAYAKAGIYSVTLTATKDSVSSSTSRTVTISAASTATADFEYSPSSPVLGQAIQFTDKSSGSPASWLWEFGDGVSDTVKDPIHTFAAAGSYVVKLTVKASSNSSSTSRTITLAQTNTIKAASPSLADVRAAIALADSGGTVLVPAGEEIWAEQLVLTKGIKIIGAGVGKTMISAGYNATSTNGTDTGSALVYYRPEKPSDTEKFRLSGFTFDLQNRCALLFIRNHSTMAIRYNRVDNNLIKNTVSYRAIITWGTVYGVIDSNIIDNVTHVAGIYGSNSISWTNLTYDFGTADNLYFEDNVITGLLGISHFGGAGGRYCVRYNSYSSPKTTGLYPWFDMHGNQPRGNHATMGVEIYENTLIMTEPKKGVGIFDHRGGKALVYNNNAITSGSVSQKCREEYHDDSKLPATGPAGQPQHVSESYYWNNRKNGSTLISAYVGSTVSYGGNKGLVPQKNREFWNQMESFNGTEGMGVGPLSKRPSSCAKGVAYWATDKQILYRYTADNTWEAYYTPYVYPHPLRSKSWD